ncbi:hypothetical protein AUK40_00745 [Candidatus Wirthbacteria bacterium CG2_30_54_11]|uniref:Uncharacterized protein n=1 Tax=Candidatus Wirthbacteria bacterium CG2_30_54_11 TaxID=1817892 RepID=A0A1J5IQR3_9BACT|nr:MAG: hypothetical protein AUK40_00745 [Candidatus Wirthbacteria bacterium CG2_30_54_11]
MGAISKTNKLMVFGLITFAVGFLLGLGSGIVLAPGRDSSLSVTGIDSLPEEALSTLNAEIQGTVVSTTDTTITLEANGQEVKLDIPEEMRSFLLSETSAYTDEDKKLWDAYQEELQKYNEAMQDFNPASAPGTVPGVAPTADPGESAVMPVYPMPPFQVSEAIPRGPDDPAPAQTQKIESTTVTLKDLKKGDTVRVSMALTTGTGAFIPATVPSAVQEPAASQERSLRVMSIYASR